MKKRLLPLLLVLPQTVFAWSLPGISDFQKEGEGIYVAQASLKKGSLPLSFTDQQQCWQPEGSIRLNQVISLHPCESSEGVNWRLYRDGDYQIRIDTRSGTPTLMLSVKSEDSTQQRTVVAPKQCLRRSEKSVTVKTEGVFPENSRVRDFYSGQTATVQNGKVTLMPAAQSGGLLLLESAETSQKAAFNWHNATVYFVLTDRFKNGNPENDRSYGRQPDGMQEIGTFHGGDLAGLTQSLDYFQQLGVNVLWISSPLEQIHGWVGGGTKGDFPHYAYHGYYPMDWTRLDANMGTGDELRALVDGAHQRGIRILFDVVMNHTGYATLTDMQQFQFGALYLKDDEVGKTLGKNWGSWKPAEGKSWHSFNDFINFSDGPAWEKWWGKGWIRTDIGDYDSPGFTDLTLSLAFLPDLKTESEQPSGLPHFYARKPDTRAKEIAGFTPRDYLTHWLSEWVREYGIDGFRIDTAKHVEKAAWTQLKQQATAALAQWKKENPEKALDDSAFWMTGEAWGHGVMQSDYYQAGFDAMINFDYQDQAARALNCYSDIDKTWKEMADKLQHFNVLSYLSSHDTRLFFHDDAKGNLRRQMRGGDLLLLAPGAIQIFYGDESARVLGPGGSDPIQGTRSDMNWSELNGDKNQVLEHWQKVAQFRARHPAIGAGVHQSEQTSDYYAFSRQWEDDRVMVIWTGD